MKFCKECGNQLTEEANFCTKCGTPVTKSPGKVAEQYGATEVLEENSVPHITNELKKEEPFKRSIPKKKLPKWLIGTTAALVVSAIAITGVVAIKDDAGSKETVGKVAASKETDVKPPEMTVDDLASLLPGWESIGQKIIDINGNYYTVLAVGQKKSDIEGSTKIVVVDYKAEPEQWTTVWETQEYESDPFLTVESYIGDLLVLDPKEENISLVAFNLMHGGSLPFYETKLLEINEQGKGRIAWEGNGMNIEKKEDYLVVNSLGETHLTVNIGHTVITDVPRSELGPKDAYKARFKIGEEGFVLPTESKEINLKVGQILTFIPANEKAKQSFDNGEIAIYTNLWNEGPVSLASANQIYGGNAIEFPDEGTFEFVLNYFNEDNPINFDNPPITFVVHVGDTENKPSEKAESTGTTSEITAPFQVGDTLSELKNHYGEPEYDDYYSGARLVTFGKDGYFLDESETVTGYYLTNPDISIFGAKVGMTGPEINDIYSEQSEPYLDEVESSGYVHTYHKNNFKIFFNSEEEDGPTISVIAIRE